MCVPLTNSSWQTRMQGGERGQSWHLLLLMLVLMLVAASAAAIMLMVLMLLLLLLCCSLHHSTCRPFGSLAWGCAWQQQLYNIPLLCTGCRVDWPSPALLLRIRIRTCLQAFMQRFKAVVGLWGTLRHLLVKQEEGLIFRWLMRWKGDQVAGPRAGPAQCPSLRPQLLRAAL